MDIAAPENGEDPRRGERSGGVDRKDSGVGVGAANEMRPEDARDIYVLDERTLTKKEFLVLLAWNGLSNQRVSRRG
jgi:hypothetical protein